MSSNRCSNRVHFRRALLGLAVCAALVATGALAAPYTHTFHYQLISGQGSASGSVTFDDSLLAPNTTAPGCDLSLLYSLDLTITNLPGTPSSTSFAKANLVAWTLVTDGSGRLTDLNFFMRSGCSMPDQVNADGYGIEGVAPFTIEVYELDGITNLPRFVDAAPSIPALSTHGAVIFAALVALAGALFAIRRFV